MSAQADPDRDVVLVLTPAEAGVVSAALRGHRSRLERSLVSLRRKFGDEAKTDYQDACLGLLAVISRRLRDARG